MHSFFQAIKELPDNRENWTAVGIDKELAGEKAVLSDESVSYRTDGFLEQLPGEPGAQLQPGILETGRGRVYLEKLGTMKKIILCGGGHVSSATLSIARMMEFHITVIEDRPGFAQAAAVAGADRVICDDFGNALETLETDQDTYILIMTRGHRHDRDCLRAVLKKKYAYLGLMGSRSRIHRIREQLQEEGFMQERIDSLHAPVGLSISAVTPAEIAVSIMAEVIQVKNVQKRLGGYDKELSAWLFSEEEKKPAVLAVIIGRKGSAPRELGTKMLIFQDGASIGTIGGGCMEAQVLSKARHMLAAGEKCDTCIVDMTGREAEDEGMVCGGTLEIYLEIL